MAVTDTLINTLFDGRYRIMRKLGAGGMANVYLAEDQELGRRVAIKILNDRHANDDQFVERFRREAKNAAGLSHPNIVSIYDRGEAEGQYYMAMEYLDGRSLKELIVSRGPAPIPVSIDYARQILTALRFAHRHGIVHRDIKPHNVLVDAEGRLKVTDFGIARAGASQMTEAGSIIGTAQYLSPEQARGAPVDESSDLYSTGVVLYELLTGAVPFTGDTAVEIAMKHLSHVPAAPSTIRPEIPHDLDLVVLRARSSCAWMLIALGIACALAAGGYFLYKKVQHQIDNSKPLTVGFYGGIDQAQATTLVKKAGFEPRVERVPNADVPIGKVFA